MGGGGGGGGVGGQNECNLVGLMSAVWVGTWPTENFGRARGYKGGANAPLRRPPP